MTHKTGRVTVSATLVKTVELEPIPVVDGDALRFRVEVFRNTRRQFTVQVWRRELFRLRPTAAAASGRRSLGSDETILVADEQLPWADIRAGTADAAVSRALAMLRRQLGAPH